MSMKETIERLVNEVSPEEKERLKAEVTDGEGDRLTKLTITLAETFFKEATITAERMKLTPSMGHAHAMGLGLIMAGCMLLRITGQLNVKSVTSIVQAMADSPIFEVRP